MKHLSMAFALLLILITSAGAATVQFTPNHLFVTGRDTDTNQSAVFEFDEAGSLVRTIPVSTANSYTYGIAFGPDGNLYVAIFGESRVVIVNPSLSTNTVLDSSNGLSSPDALSFGPDGTLYVPNRGNKKIVTRKSDGTVGEITFSDSNFIPAAVTFGVAGNRYVTDNGNDEVHEQDPSGREIRTFGQGTLGGYPANVLEGPGGLLYVATCGSSVYVFDSSGTLHSTIHHPDISCGYGLAFGPNGNLFVCSFGNGSIIEFTLAGAHVRTITIPTMNNPTYLAFAPHRLTALLKGSVQVTGSGLLKISQSNAVLSVTPGSRTIMLAVPDDAANPSDYASLFGGIWHVFHGFENFSDADAVLRFYHGNQVTDRPTTDGVGAVSLSVKGVVDTHGWFTVKSVTGNLLRAGDNAQFNGTLTGKPIK